MTSGARTGCQLVSRFIYKFSLNYNYFRCDGFENWRYSIQNVDGSSVIRHHGIETKRTTPVQNIEDID